MGWKHENMYRTPVGHFAVLMFHSTTHCVFKILIWNLKPEHAQYKSLILICSAPGDNLLFIFQDDNSL